MLFVACLNVVCCLLRDLNYSTVIKMLNYVILFIVAICMLYVACCMLYVACCMLHVACCMLYVLLHVVCSCCVLQNSPKNHRMPWRSGCYRESCQRHCASSDNRWPRKLHSE